MTPMRFSSSQTPPGRPGMPGPGWSKSARAAACWAARVLISRPGRGVSTGYVLAEEFWGKGYAIEALRAVLELLKNSSVWRVEALCHIDHDASARVLEKAGFELEGTLAPAHDLFPTSRRSRRTSNSSRASCGERAPSPCQHPVAESFHRAPPPREQWPRRW